MKQNLTLKCITIALALFSLFPFSEADKCRAQGSVKNAYIWSDYPDPDIIRVGEYYYLVTTTMHLFPGGPIMRSKDLVNWETVSYLTDVIKDTPRYDLNEGTVYGRGQWATSLRYNKGTFWALFVANDDPHKSMVFKTDDPAKGWKLHSRLPAYHDSSLFFDDDGRVYVFSGSGNIHLVELEPDLTAEKKGGVNKVLELQGKPDGLHEGSRVIKHDGMYYLLCISWPRSGRQEICYRSKNIEGPYESKVIFKSPFGGFPYAGQGTIVDGKRGEWYGVMFQDRGGVGRILTLEPCSWIDGWPMLGNKGDGLIPDSVKLYDVDASTFQNLTPVNQQLSNGVTLTKDYQWNHNFVSEAISAKNPQGEVIAPTKIVKGSTITLKGILNNDLPNNVKGGIYSARNTLTWRTWGPTCSDTITIDASKIKDGDCVGLSALNGDAALLTVKKEGSKYFLVFTEENVQLSEQKKEITEVKRKEVARIPLASSKVKDIRMVMNCDFNPGCDMATFSYSIDKGKTWKSIGNEYKMIFDYRRLFMGTRYAAFYYPTKQAGGTATITLK